VKKYLRGLGLLLVWFCIGTVLAQAIWIGMLWWKGAFADERVLAMYAALHGIFPESDAAATGPAADPNQEQLSLVEVAQRRMLSSLDLDLRETALDKGLADLRNIRAQIETEDQRLNLWKETFDIRLKKMESTALEVSLLEVQKTLEAIQPKQAKEQILKMLDDSPDGRNEHAMQDIVKILKAMPLDKRRKILGEFKSEDEVTTLAEILKEIRLGAPEVDLIRDTRASLMPSSRTQR
jgi:hypothetical protein